MKKFLSPWSINKAADALIHYMRMVMDPRCGRKTKHDYAEILTYVVIGYLTGRLSLRRCLAWCQRHLEWLREHMGLKNGIASVSTVSRILSSVDEEMFCLAFIEWMAGILGTKGITIAIDGKALRGGTEKIKGGKTPYILNAIDVLTGLVIAQLPIGEKENEKTAIPKLLKLLNIENSMITIDAAGTTQTIMDEIHSRGGGFLLTVKKSSPLTYKELQETFDILDKENSRKKKDPGYVSGYEEFLDTYEVFEKNEKNRSRMEYRTMETCHNTSILTMTKNTPCIKTIGWLRQVRIPMEKDPAGNDITPDYETFLKQGTSRKPKITAGDDLTDDIHMVGIISNVEIGAEDALKIKREHWKIENNLHHVLDDVFREDRSSAKKSRNNLALIRKFAYNILRIASIQENIEKGHQEMSDLFADDLDLLSRYVFKGIESFR